MSQVPVSRRISYPVACTQEGRLTPVWMWVSISPDLLGPLSFSQGVSSPHPVSTGSEVFLYPLQYEPGLQLDLLLELAPREKQVNKTLISLPELEWWWRAGWVLDDHSGCTSRTKSLELFLLTWNPCPQTRFCPTVWSTYGPALQTTYRVGRELRWWRNRTGRPLSPLQIHRKNIWTLSKLHKTTSFFFFTKQLLIASRGHQPPRKAAHCLRKEVGQNIKDKKRDNRVRDGDRFREGSLNRGRFQIPGNPLTGGSGGSFWISEGNLTGRKNK